MPEYIPKMRVAVTVGQSGKPSADGHFSLAHHSAFHPGPETLFERLNAPDRVIPFHRAEDGAVLMLSRHELEWVMAGSGVPDAHVCPPTHFATAEERVRVRFRSGATLEGMLRIELPEHLNRASDFLNGPEDFFPLVTGRGMRLVNKAQMVDVLVFESSPMPRPMVRAGFIERR